MNALSNRMQAVYFAAAVSLIILCAVAIAAITGHITGAASAPSPEAAVPATNAPAGTPARSASPSRLFAAQCAACGVIEDIRAVQVNGEASGLGAAAGGITGALVGSQFGRGNGRTLGAIAGAAGGAFAGNAIEKNMHKHVVYRISLRMDDGSHRTVTESREPPFAVGDRVRLVDGTKLERA